MTKTRRFLHLVLAALCAGFLALPVSAQPNAERAAQSTSAWHGDYFPNVVLQDHNGRNIRFYDDLIRGKVVAINFVYTRCEQVCPLDIAQMRRVQTLLGNRVGRDIFFFSISINPERDTPAELRRTMRTYDVQPGWTFLTGSRRDIETLQRRFGMTVVGVRNLRAHDTDLVMGNETTGEWIRRSSFENPQNIATLLGSTLHNYATPATNAPRIPYGQVGRITETSRGAYLFRTRCRNCHTVGEGDRLGPDLRGVVASRDPRWLSRWIREPDRMIAERDPIALALLPQYRNLRMPNLSLGPVEADAIIDYLRTQDAVASAATPTRSTPGGR